jgi:regulatory protein
VQLLAARPHFRRELQLKLVQRDFPEDEIESALDRLAAQGLVDDTRTAAAFVAHRQDRRAEGRHRLRAELQRRGAGPEAIDLALAQLPDDDLDQAREAAREWTLRRGPGRAAARAEGGEAERTGQSPAPPQGGGRAEEESTEGEPWEPRRGATLSLRGASRSPSRTPEPESRNRAALARHLERRGFSRRAIVAVLNAAGAEPEEDA